MDGQVEPSEDAVSEAPCIRGRVEAAATDWPVLTEKLCEHVTMISVDDLRASTFLVAEIAPTVFKIALTDWRISISTDRPCHTHKTRSTEAL